MIGGDPETFHGLEPVFQTLAPAEAQGYGHTFPRATLGQQRQSPAGTKELIIRIPPHATAGRYP